MLVAGVYAIEQPSTCTHAPSLVPHRHRPAINRTRLLPARCILQLVTAQQHQATLCIPRAHTVSTCRPALCMLAPAPLVHLAAACPSWAPRAHVNSGCRQQACRCSIFNPWFKGICTQTMRLLMPQYKCQQLPNQSAPCRRTSSRSSHYNARCPLCPRRKQAAAQLCKPRSGVRGVGAVQCFGGAVALAGHCQRWLQSKQHSGRLGTGFNRAWGRG